LEQFVRVIRDKCVFLCELHSFWAQNNDVTILWVKSSKNGWNWQE